MNNFIFMKKKNDQITYSSNFLVNASSQTSGDSQIFAKNIPSVNINIDCFLQLLIQLGCYWVLSNDTLGL